MSSTFGTPVICTHFPACHLLWLECRLFPEASLQSRRTWSLRGTSEITSGRELRQSLLFYAALRGPDRCQIPEFEARLCFGTHSSHGAVRCVWFLDPLGAFSKIPLFFGLHRVHTLALQGSFHPGSVAGHSSLTYLPGSDHVLCFWLSISPLSQSPLSALGTGLAPGLPAAQAVAANTPLQWVAVPGAIWAGGSESGPALSSGSRSSSYGMASLERGMYRQLGLFWQKQQQKGPFTVNITSNTVRSRQGTEHILLLAITFYCRKSCLRPFFTLLADEHSHLPICQKRPLGGDSPPPRQL